MPANNGDVLIGRIGALDLGDEAGSAHYIESGNTEQTLRVVDSLALEDLSTDGDGGVDLFKALESSSSLVKTGAYRIRDDEEVGIRSGISSSFGQISNDASVGVEEI